MNTALVVDDIEENRYLLKTLLEANGWAVVEAANGSEALQTARRNKPDLVFSDILMPEMDGYALCKAWKADEHLAAVPFIFCTATFTDDMDENLADKMGADGFIRQPVEPDGFARKLKSLESRLQQGEPPRAPSNESTQDDVLREYSRTLSRKLDHKVLEYRDTIENLDRSHAALERKSLELSQRVKELTCVHTLNDLARDPNVDFETLCQHAANEIADAFHNPRVTHVRINFGTFTSHSPGFQESERHLGVQMCDNACPESCPGSIDIFVETPVAGHQSAFLPEEEKLVRSTANLLCLEYRGRKQTARERMVARRASTLLRLSNESAGKPESNLVQDYLEASIELTESAIGYLYSLNEDLETIQLVAWSKDALGICDAVHDSHFPLSKAGIWADCVRDCKPAVHNDYAEAANKRGLPQGLAPLQRHLSVPVTDGDAVTLILSVGNRKKPYESPEIETLQVIGGALAQVMARHRSEQALQASSSRLTLLDAAVNAASHSIVITDVDGTIEWVNPAFTQLTGYTADEAIGKNPRLLKSGKQDREFYQNLWNTITGGKVWKGELINKRKDGSLYDEEASITPVKDATGKITHFIAIKQDVTEQHQLKERLLRSQRMESIGLLAGGVAHDLNNVLAPIMMAVEMLKQDLTEEDRLIMLETLESSCNRGSAIIRQVLTFARGVEGEHAVLQVRHLLKDLVKMSRETFPKNITISLDAPGDLWTVSGDATQLHQVLLNLALNARDAMPTGGTLSIKAENVTLDHPRGYLNCEILPGAYIRLQVKDGGVGIPPDAIARIFEPFFTTKEQGKGTGLGLPTAFGIVKSHDGLLEVESTPGRGTTFLLHLPASEIETPNEDIPPSKPPRGNGETILVVDDEAAIRQLTQKILEMNGYMVLLAEDGAEAVACYAQHKAEIALVLSDMMMPVMDGLALVRALRAINPEVRIVGFSGYIGDDANTNRFVDLRTLGVRTILEKPVAADRLLHALAEELPF